MPAQGSPTSQAILYEIGFIDEATKGLEKVDANFNQTEKALDGIVGKMDVTASAAKQDSQKYAEAMEQMTDAAPASLKVGADSFTENLEVGLSNKGLVDGLEDNLEGASTKFTDDMSKGSAVEDVGGDGKGGFFEGLKKMMPMMMKGLKMFIKFIPAATAMVFALKAIAPLLEMIGFFAEVLLMPFQDMFAQLGMMLIPAVNELAKVLFGLAEKIMPALENVIFSLLPVVSMLIDKFRVFTEKYIIPAIEWITELTVKFFEWEHAWKVVAGIIGAMFLPMIVLATKAVIAFGIALLANPITWIAIAIVAVGVALYTVWKHWGAVKDAALSAWDVVKDGVMWFLNIFKGPVESVMEMFGLSWDGIKEKIFSVWDVAKGFFKDIIELGKKALSFLPGVEFEEERIIPTEQFERSVTYFEKAKNLSRLEAEQFVRSRATSQGFTIAGETAISKAAGGADIGVEFVKPMKTATVEPIVSARQEGKEKKTITDPILSGLNKGFTAVVDAIEDQDLSYTDISERMRSLGAFIG